MTYSSPLANYINSVETIKDFASLVNLVVVAKILAPVVDPAVVVKIKMLSYNPRPNLTSL